MKLITTIVLLNSAFVVAASWPEFSPFGNLTWTRFGSLPNSPNPSFEGFLLHLMAVDLYQAPGTPVYSVNSGIPSLPNTDKSAEDAWVTTVQITSFDGLMSYYMHLDPSSIPAELREKVKSRSFVERGTLLGKLIFGGGFSSHLHFGMADCHRRVRLNPLKYLRYRDTQAPTVTQILAFPSTPSHPTEISGAVQLTAMILDSIDEMDGFYPPNRVELEIAPSGDTSRSPSATFRSVLFDVSEIPAGTGADENCSNFMAYDSYDPDSGNMLYRWQNDYPQKGYAFALTTNHPMRLKELSDWIHPHPGPWKTDACDVRGAPLYPNGRYRVLVRAFDAAGNLGEAEQVFKVNNSVCGP